MNARQRLLLLVAAAACLLVVAILAWMVSWDRAPLGPIDQRGKAAEAFSDNHAWLLTLLRWVEVSFATVGMILWSSIVTAVLLYRRLFKAAAWVVAVMVATSLATTFIKGALARGRPGWQDQTDLLASKSFPSGHASSTAALTAILLILIWMQPHNSSGHVAAMLVLIASWVVVCLDRVLLGRHYPTDVVAGTALGIAVTLIGLAIFAPVVPKPSTDGLDTKGQ